MALSKGLTLFTSDSRLCYASDVLSVLALPDGFSFHFRYDSRHISTDNRREIEGQNVAGTRILIAFKDESGAKENAPYIVPLRWAILSSVEKIPDFYIFNFILSGYPAFVKEFTGAKDSLIQECSRYIAELPNFMQQFPVQQGLTPFVETTPRIDRVGWIDVAKRLALHATFADTYFLRIDSIRYENGAPVTKNADGELMLQEAAYLRFQIDFFAVKFPETTSELKITTDSSLIRIASRSVLPLDSRYDSTKVLVQGGVVPGRTATGISISTVCSKENTPQTSIYLPILLTRARWLLFKRLSISAVGAALVAMPGILGTDTDKYFLIGIALVGAILVAIGSIIGASTK